MSKHSMLGSTAVVERKDDNGNNRAVEVDTKKAVGDSMTAFTEFKTTNDQRLKAIETRGSADVLDEAKLKRLDTVLDGYEGMNQKLTLAGAQKKAMDDLQERFDALETVVSRSGKSNGEDKAIERKQRANAWARAVVDAHTVGVANLTDDQRKCLTEIATEMKALNVSTDTAGGYLAPVEYVREMIKAVTEQSPVRALARVRSTSMKAMQIPKRTGQFAARRTTEQGTRTETTGLTYGLEELNAPEMYALIDISNQMLEDSAFDMEAEIREEASEQFAVKEGSEFVSGSGVGECEGVLTNTSVLTTNSGAATTVTADGILTLKYAIKTAYARNASFILNRTTMGSVRKLKDGNGQYLWMPGIAMGQPNTIDGDPYVEVPDMPNEGAGNKPVAYGDFRRAYTLLDRISMEMLRDPYTQATAGNVRFILRKRVGGQVVLAEAIRTLTCST